MFKVPESARITTGKMATTRNDGNNGSFLARIRGGEILCCIASDSHGWEHVSVSRPDRSPSWEEMAAVKALFWDEDDTVYQIHPPHGHYPEDNPRCLHLWRPAQGPMTLPPKFLVGVR